MKVRQLLAVRFVWLWIFLASIVSPVLTNSLHAQGRAGCSGSSTVADLDPGAVQPAQAFLAQVKAAVKADSPSMVLRLVDYPLRVNTPAGARSFRSRQSLLAHFSTVFTGAVKEAILNQQPACLFANSQGIMIGKGELWFDKTPRGRYAILSINLR